MSTFSYVVLLIVLFLFLYVLCFIFSCSFFFFSKQKTAYEMRISDWSSDGCSSDLDSGGYPWLIGLSRKSMIGHVIGREPADRVFGSVAAALAAVARGGHIVRVHDVAATVDAVKIWRAIEHGDFL